MQRRMILFDSHCHLGLKGSLSEAMVEHSRALASGVGHMILVGIDAASSECARDLTDSLNNNSSSSVPAAAAAAAVSSSDSLGPSCRPPTSSMWTSTTSWSAGLHPNATMQFAEDMPKIRAMVHANHPHCVAIGETGLDLFRQASDFETQKRSFIEHLELAKQYNKPVIIHCRDAYNEMLPILRSYAPVRGVMHCFASDAQHAQAFVDLGLHISFAGPVTYPRNDELRRACQAVPPEMLLVETDAPFLPPQSCRGKRNEPMHVREVVDTVARVRGLSPEDAALLTSRNAAQLFGIRYRE